jgi:hypothetical protein
MFDTIYQWLDLLWIPIGVFAVHKEQRIKTAVFIVTCIFTLRTQVKFGESFGFDTGVFSIIDSSLLYRGYVVYGFFIASFILLAFFSPKTEKIIVFAAAISMYLLAFCVYFLSMLL